MSTERFYASFVIARTLYSPVPQHTRRPVDDMVAAAKELKPGETLPFLKLEVSERGVNILEMPKNINKNFDGGFYPIEIIR